MVHNESKKHFWIIITVIATIIFGMIYFLSATQAKEEKESQILENKLNEQISTTKGFKASVQQINAENESLKSTLVEKESEINDLYKKNENLASFAEMLTLYINRSNDDRIRVLISLIDRNALVTEQQILFDKIRAEFSSEQAIE